MEDVTRHPALLDEVIRNCPNTIVLLESTYPLRRYTCAMHVFDFIEKPEYAAIAERGLNRVFAGGAFVHWLLDERLLEEIAPRDAREGVIVVYFNEAGLFKHAGITVREDRVVSKWGTGHLFEHGLFEVPESYGTKVRFFRKLRQATAYEYFMLFAKDNGMLLDETS